MTDFSAKNAARREGRARVGAVAYRQARSLRRSCHGAFGDMTGRAYDDHAVGTRGEK